MGKLAHRALSLVIAKHDGCLGSYAADKRARLFKAYEMVEECEDQVRRGVGLRFDGSDPAVFDRCALEPIGPLRRAMTVCIRRFAPELLPMPESGPNPAPFSNLTVEHIRRLYMKRLRDDARNKRRRIKR